MAIRSLKTPAEIAEYTFRSLPEMEQQVQLLEKQLNELNQVLLSLQSKLGKQTATAANETSVKFTEHDINTGVSTKSTGKGAGSPTIDFGRWNKVSIPNVETLKNHFGLVDEFYEKLDVLRTMEGYLKLHFKNRHGSGDVVKGMERLRKVTEARIAEALKVLQAVATKHVPEPFVKFMEAVNSDLAKQLKYDKYETYLYVYPNAKGDLEFTAYFRLINLVDTSGSSFPDIYLVFTCTLEADPKAAKKVLLKYRATTLKEFSTPGKFSAGQVVRSPHEALVVLGALLELENFSNALGVLPIYAPEGLSKKNFAAKNYIYRLDVSPNSLEFTLIKSVKAEDEATSIAAKIMLDLKPMFKNVKAEWQARKFQRSGAWVIHFTMNNFTMQGQVTLKDMEPLSQKYGIEDDKLRQIVRIINES